MTRGLFCFVVCLLMVLGSVVPVSGTLFTPKSSQLMKQRDVQCDGMEKIFNELKEKIDTVTTKQEALVLVNEAIVELNEHGLLPNGMSVRQAQRLVTGCFSKSEQIQPSQNSNENITGNTNCLVIGFANETFFRPYPTIYDIPIIRYLMDNTSFGDYFNFLIWFYAIRAFQPIKVGPYAFVGGRGRVFENGNVTYEWTDAPSGWVWTLGKNGVRKWNGTFYGGISTRYLKSILNNITYAEAWDPVGIRGFIGLNFFSFRTFWKGNDVPTFYIGFAREINFTYSPPWT